MPQQQATSAKTMTKGAKDNNAGSRAIIITVMIPTAKGLSPISAMTTVTVFERKAKAELQQLQLRLLLFMNGRGF